MTATVSRALCRCYDVDGIGLEVCADDPAVVEAMDLRLRGFAPAPLLEGETELRVAFAAGAPERPRGDGRPVYDVADGTLRYFPAQDVLFGEIGGVTVRCEAGRGAAAVGCRAFTGRSLYLATHPVATVMLMELLKRRGRFSLHAACLGEGDGRGVLLAGPSGAGKSTLAIALARAGMELLSDDIVFLAPGAGGREVRAIGFADALGITDATVSRFRELAGAVEAAPAPGFPKRLARPEPLFGTPGARWCLPRALVLCEVAAGAPSAIAPLDGGEALRRLVPDVLLTEPACTQEHLAAIAALLDQASCYALRSGRDLERAAALVRGLL